MKTIKQGDIFEIDGHIIACGNSLDESFVDKVIGDKKIRAIVSDPPYAVAYVENKKGICKLGIEDERIIANDHLQTDEEYAKFTKDWLDPVTKHLESYNACYIFNGDLMFPALRHGMKESGYYYSQMIVWLKNQPVMSRKDYLSMYELIAYGWHGRHKMERSKAKNVIFHPKPSSSKLHPTQKPVGLLRKIIPNSTKIHEYVYDPFLGSGSVAVACSHLGRKCIGIEIDEKYISTVISRLEILSGKQAKKI